MRQLSEASRALRRGHAVAGGCALVTIAVFWTSTVVVEVLGSREATAAVKTAIAWGLLLLVPALAATGLSGRRLAAGSGDRLVALKQRRMAVAALNGLLVLVPAALFLAIAARAGRFDLTFAAVQAAELLAGAVNLTLLSLNLRSGLAMTGRLHRRT